MGILDGLEVSIKIPESGLPLTETPVGPGYQSNDGVLPWAPSPLRSENYIMAPEGRTFGVCITLHPKFDQSMADGLHVTLQFDDSQIVNHYYSIKFDEMDRDAAGRLTKTIPSALVRYGSVYQTVLFQFRPMGSGE